MNYWRKPYEIWYGDTSKLNQYFVYEIFLQPDNYKRGDGAKL